MLEVIEQNNQLVVDSRLIAEELGITHKAFKETVRENQADIEEAFGKVALETAPSEANGGGGSGETYYWLTEEQATYLMTLSRNTEQVKRAKLNLVKAFSKAKLALQTIQKEAVTIDMFLNFTQQLQSQMALLTERTQRLNELEQNEKAFDAAAKQHPGCAEIIVDEIENLEDTSMTGLDFMELTNLDLRYRKKLTTSAANFQRLGTNTFQLPTNSRGQLLIQVKYLRRAAKNLTGL